MATRQEQQNEARREQASAAGHPATSAQSGASRADAERQLPRSDESGQGAMTTRRAGSRGMVRGGYFPSPWELMRRMNEQLAELAQSIQLVPDADTARGQRRDMTPFQRGAADLGTPAIWAPRIEMQQRDGELVVRAELAGIEADEIDVTIADGMLVLSGERQQERQEDEGPFVRSERVYGSFYRAIPLPDGADEDNVTADFRNGVLELRIPVANRERGRRIAVRSSSRSDQSAQSGQGGQASQASAGSQGSQASQTSQTSQTSQASQGSHSTQASQASHANHASRTTQ